MIGRAEPGYELEHNPRVGRKIAIKKLRKFRSDEELRKYLHLVFVDLKVRYVGSGWKSDRKAAAGVKNFRTLEKAGGPRKFFEGIAAKKSEVERIEAMQESMAYFGMKGARDTLIDLGLAENCMALDVRIFGVLEKVGVRIPPDDIYRQIEKELIQKVAGPLKITGGRLDRILFQNYFDILQGS